MRPAPMSSASVTAICATASAPRNRLPRRSPPILPPALSASTRLTFDAMSAGASPQTKADSSVSPHVKSSAVRLISTASMRGMSAGARLVSASSSISQQDAQSAACDGQRQALDHPLAREPSATGAERGPQRDLPAPRGRSGELEIGDVGAGDQQ